MLCIIIVGTSSLIGTASTEALRVRGSEVVQLIQQTSRTAHKISWAPDCGELNQNPLQGFSAIVNLGGAKIANKRWISTYKQLLVDSRVNSTHSIASAIVHFDDPVHLANGLAMEFYDNRGDEVVNEESLVNSDFFADLVTKWETAAVGGMGQLPPLIKLVLTGSLNSTKQWWSWIALRNQVAGSLNLINQSTFYVPMSVRQRGAVKQLWSVLYQPALLLAPTPPL